jgi:hypothetical protein
MKVMGRFLLSGLVLLTLAAGLGVMLGLKAEDSR